MFEREEVRADCWIMRNRNALSWQSENVLLHLPPEIARMGKEGAARSCMQRDAAISCMQSRACNVHATCYFLRMASGDLWTTTCTRGSFLQTSSPLGDRCASLQKVRVCLLSALHDKKLVGKTFHKMPPVLLRRYNIYGATPSHRYPYSKIGDARYIPHSTRP